MVVDNTPINVNNVLIENVQCYVYLGQHYSLKEKNHGKEIQRRVMAGWAAYAKHWDIFKSNIAICLKRQVYNSCVLPAMTYGAETCTEQTCGRRDQHGNKYAKHHTQIYKDQHLGQGQDKIHRCNQHGKKMKWSWAGYSNRLNDDRWTSRVTTWRPCDKKRRQGRPVKRWRDDLDKYILERHDMAEDITRQGNLETAC